MLRGLYILTLLLSGISTYAQTPEIDSLRNVMATAKADTVLVKTRNQLAWQLKSHDLEEAYALSKENMEALKSFDRPHDMATATFCHALSNLFMDSVEQSIPYFKTAIELYKQEEDSYWASRALNRLGLLYNRLGRPAESIETHLDALSIREAAQDSTGIAGSLNNIGNVYQEQNDYEESRKYYEKAAEINRKTGNKAWLAINISNIGNIYTYTDRFNESIKYQNQAMDLYREAEDTMGMCRAYVNLAINYRNLKDYDESIKNYQKAKALGDSISNYELIAFVYDGIGDIELNRGNYRDCIDQALKGLEIAEKRKYYSLIETSCFKLFTSYEKLGVIDSAYHYYKKYAEFKETKFNESNTKAITEAAMKYEYEKEALADSIRREEEAHIAALEKKNEELENQRKLDRKNNIIYLVIAILGLLFLLFIYIFRQFKAKKKLSEALIKTNEEVLDKQREIEQQKDIVEEKNKEIMDSISYAKRLQDAILPSKETIDSLIPNSHIFYKPKDVVSGDFYWLNEVDGWRYIAVVDCTGHGVPGAMVSLVGKNALDKCILEEGIREPNLVLDRLTVLIEETFSHSDAEIRDGMDVAIYRIKDNQLEFSGANNPLWVLRDNECIELKADKQPIGRYVKKFPFTLHSFELQKEDTLYVFSDGYSDQFGGEKGKKMKVKNFKELVVSNIHKSVVEQGQIIAQRFEEWKGDYEQLDDVCVIGVRV